MKEQKISTPLTFILLAVCFLSTQCAQNTKRKKLGTVIQESPQKDLVELFHLEKDQLTRFKTQDPDEKEETLPPQKEPPKDKIEEIKSPVIETKKINPADDTIALKKAADKISKQESTQNKTQETKKNSQEIVYPSDYPEDFIKYDEKSKLIWSKFTPIVYPEERMLFNIKYFGITCGKIELQTKKSKILGDDKAFHFFARMSSAPFYKYLYTLDDYIETFIKTDDFRPLKYTLIQRESGQTVDDLQIFDDEQQKTFYWYKRLKKGEETKREEGTFIPYYFQDSYSALHFVRGLPLKLGDTYEFPVVTRGKIWLLKVHVHSKDTVEVMDTKIPAIQLKAETRFPGVLKKKGDIIFWYSEDQTHRLLKFSAKVKIGSVEGELIDYEGPRNISDS